MGRPYARKFRRCTRRCGRRPWRRRGRFHQVVPGPLLQGAGGAGQQAAEAPFTATRASTLAAIRARSEYYGLEPGASADVIPWDISTQLAQDLRYTPQAHTPELVGLHKRAAGRQPDPPCRGGQGTRRADRGHQGNRRPTPDRAGFPRAGQPGRALGLQPSGQPGHSPSQGRPRPGTAQHGAAQLPLAQPGVHAVSPRAGADGLRNGERPGAGPGSPGSQGRAQPGRCSSDRQQSAVSRRHLRPARAGGDGMGLAGGMVVLAGRHKKAITI